MARWALVLQSKAFSMSLDVDVGNGQSEKGELTRVSAYRVFAGAPNLVMDIHMAGVLDVPKREDTGIIDLVVRVPPLSLVFH